MSRIPSLKSPVVATPVRPSTPERTATPTPAPVAERSAPNRAAARSHYADTFESSPGAGTFSASRVSTLKPGYEGYALRAGATVSVRRVSTLKPGYEGYAA